MPTPTELREDFNTVIDENGTPITVRYWSTGSIFYTATDYDDEALNTGSSTVISGAGIIMPVGPGDTQYIHQGKLLADDMKLFVAGSLTLISNARITVGNTGSVYEVVPDMLQRWDVSGTTIYQKAFIRTRPDTT